MDCARGAGLGDALPTEAELREQFGVSRVTVRQALKQLTELNVIESIQAAAAMCGRRR